MIARLHRLLLILLTGVVVGSTSALAGTAQVNAWLIGAGRSQVIAGQPLRIGVEIAPAEGSTEPVVIVARGEDWRSDVVVELFPEVGGGVAITVAQTQGASVQKQITATAENPVTGLWWIPAATTGKLAPGKYLLRMRWSGAEAPEATAVEILPTTTAQEPAARTLALAYDDVLGGHPEAAAQRVDALLKETADNIDLLTFRGLLCLSAGDPVSANACLVRAQAVAANIKNAEPSVTLYELRRRFEDSEGEAALTAARGVGTGAIPAWSRPPETVFRALGSTAASTATAASAAATNAAGVKSSAPGVVANNAGSASEKSAAPVVPKSANRENETSTPATVGASSAPAVAKAEPVSNYASVEAGVTLAPGERLEAAIRADAHGQWATGAKASSEYGAPGYAAMQATGSPNVAEGGDNTSAWCPGSSAKGLQWIELTYAKPVHATEIRVRQSYNPGAVVKIEVIDMDGSTHLWWSGVDPARPPGALNAIAWFSVRVPRTTYRVATVRVTLDIDAVASWQEIDAVQLVGEE